MKTKYIVFKEGTDEDIVIFGCTQNHSDIADKMRLTSDDVVSAGFVSIGYGGEGGLQVSCYGKSDSLEIESRETEDTCLAKFALDPNGEW